MVLSAMQSIVQRRRYFLCRLLTTSLLLGLLGHYRPIASAIRPSVPTMTRHHANNPNPRRVT